MKKLTILFLSVLLFSCCPCEKKNTHPQEETNTNKAVEVDSSHFKTISKEKDSNVPNEDIEWLFEREFGPV